MTTHYQGVKYSVDIVICIDATGSMTPVIDNVKKGALKFHDDLNAKMTEKGKSIDQLRIKIVVFRDFYCDGDLAFKVSGFFALPDKKEDFSNFVSKIVATGGGDEPENGLEAVDVAIKSDWNPVGDKRRQIVVVWTDASSHKLELNEGSKPSNYPSDMAKNYDDLTDNWESGDFVNDSFKRIILFAPEAYPWTNISNDWSNSIHWPSQAGEGLSDVDYSEIMQAIANSV